MSRLIDADALMKAMYHRAFETDGDTMWQSGCWVRYRALEQVVKEQPTIVKHKNGKWIPVTEALPETDEFVLISVNGDYNHQHFLHAIMIGDYIEDDGWMINEYPEIETVTANHLVEAWMPLPEMYEGH